LISIGIDPGKHGAIATIRGDGASAVPIPIIKASKGNGRDEYDLVAIREILCSWLGCGIFVTVEKAQPLPPKMKGGGIANYHRGVSRGLWEAMLVALRLPYQLVAPRTWQKLMHAGTSGADTKQRSIIAAQRLFPGADLRRTERSKKPDDGIAEALLLAEYGRRVHGVGQ